jgi:hypothetical protein
VALAVFGAIVALAGLVVVGQVIGRQLASDTVDSDVLRALGAGPVVTASARVAGLLGAAVVGAALAVVAALALSPLAPLGPVRPVYPHRGISADWVVLGGGFAVVVAALAALALVLAWRQAPHRVMGTARHRARLPRASRRLPVAAATGLRFSMDTGDQRTAVGMRSAVLGTALAVTVVTGAVTFGSSLSTLISHPALYGWSWDYALDGGGGAGAVPGTASSRLLGANPDVAAWSPVYFANLQIDGQTVPVLGADPRAAVAPPVLSGRGLEATDQIVLGATTLASLHKHIGDSVDVRYGVANPTPLRIVGTASLPALGIGGVEVTHLSMSTGALLAYGLIPASVRNSFGNSPPGPNAILIRARPGAPRGRLLASLTRMASQLSLPTNYGVTVLGVQRPAEIVNYRSMRATPAYLAAGLGLGAVGGLGLTLIATVRRRRRDLAVLKTLGFTRRQLGSVIAWQSTFAVLTGTVVGLPLGIAAGRTLWDAFATAIGAVPTPRVPGATIAAIGVGALALGNLVTLVPARLASHVPAALALRAE